MILKRLLPVHSNIQFKSTIQNNSKITLLRFIHNTQKPEQYAKLKRNVLDNKKLCQFRIIHNKPNATMSAISKISLARSNVVLEDMELNLYGGEKLCLNLTWLRDQCQCDHCTHKPSWQRHFTPKRYKSDLFGVETAKLIQLHNQPAYDDYNIANQVVDNDNAGFLSVNWSDGHVSLYSLNWLRHVESLGHSTKEQIEPLQIQQLHIGHQIDERYNPKYECQVELWPADAIEAKLKAIDYNDLMDGYKGSEESTFINENKLLGMRPKRLDAMFSLTQQLMRYGLAKITNVPCDRDHVLKVADSLAYARPTGYGLVFNVVVEKSLEKNLAYDSGEFDLHVDLAYREKSPGAQLLHCLENSNEGGLSYFSDAFYAAKLLQQEEPILFDVLVQYPVTFSARDPYRDTIFRHIKPVLTLNNSKNLKEVYYSPWALPPIGNRNDIKLFYLAIDRYTDILHSEKCKFITKMNHGDLFIFHNRRVLHGRSAYQPGDHGRNRFLQGTYMDWDEIESLYEKLNTFKRFN